MRNLLAALRYPLAFAIVAAIIAFYPLCLDTYQILLDDKAPLNIQGEVSQKLPIPRALYWSPATKNLIVSLTLMPPGAVIGLGIGLFSILIYGVLRMLNPTFRLTTGVDWDRTVLTETYIHTAPLIKAFLIAVAALVPLFILWVGLAYLTGDSFPARAFRFALAGAGVWTLFSREGIAGDYENLNYELPRYRNALKSLLLRGALAGLAVSFIVELWQFTAGGQLFDFYASLGSIGEGNWRAIAGLTCGAAAVLGFSGALMLMSLAPPNLSRKTRTWLGIGGLGVLCAFAAVRGIAFPNYLAARYHYDPARNLVDESGIPRGSKLLADRTGVPLRPNAYQTVIVFRRDRVSVWKVPHTSITELDAGTDSAARIARYMSQHNYTTSLADPAFKTLHDSASLQWDNLAGLELDMRNLESAPDVQYIRLLVAKLTTSPSTPDVLKVADRLADETRFAYVTRDSRMTMGDIYGRLGRRDKAAAWYRKADVPESRIPELLSARTMFADGKISGRLLLNGKPMAGARVGIAPFRTIRDAFASILVPGVVRPFWLRWIGPTAVTDANGRFEITRITAGEYRLLFTHPDLDLPPMDTRLIANTNAGRIFVGFGRPATQLGDIEMMLGEGASGPELNRPSPGPRASPGPPPPSDRSPAI